MKKFTVTFYLAGKSEPSVFAGIEADNAHDLAKKFVENPGWASFKRSETHEEALNMKLVTAVDVTEETE